MSRRSPPSSSRSRDHGLVLAEKTSSREPTLPTHVNKYADANGNSKLTPHIKAAGESGRRGIHPLHFFRIAFRSSSRISMVVSILWPVVPAAIAVKYARHEWHMAIFVLAYIAMVPCANLVGFAGQEFARKVPHVAGVLVETCFGSVVEIVLFMVLLSRDQFPVIQAAILGSILATMLLCLGLCFFAGGMKRDESSFSEVVSEAGNGLLLTAGFGLAVPTVFRWSLAETENAESLTNSTMQVSRITSILLIIAYFVYIWFQARTHHGIYAAIFEHDEERDNDKTRDMHKDKLTLTECAIALAISIALVTILAIALVDEIPFIIEHGVSDPFMGLILVPLVEKAAEHLTAIDEAWDNQMNFALSHVLGATLQTALFNAPLVVIVGWGLQKEMGLDFEIFNMVVLILAIVTVGQFLRDGKSNYLEGFLCVIVYIAIAVAAFYYPNPHEEGSTAEGGGESSGSEAHRLMMF
ncbi:putative ca2+ h+ antiporter protein [Phaeoacremonium minimum UCRPA7]|uniref:Vacuolar calcium ion transporter n=1 Tax=Phaeoacremonium minimum (strain UCR-PA7) TaxID=1286976 RepID=R8BBF1_PHAM7|nr:putative ca2+ h+ antiporter protein [Phaeoacremonium minimum UCRPA7]EON96626.1 putative ca2+ h+ antiporter protein [Phaeoacremonium minimum UCRPA7]